VVSEQISCLYISGERSEEGKKHSDICQVVSERDSVCILQMEEKAEEDRALEDSVLTVCKWTAVENVVIGTIR
jgi:hypothetical protein